MSNNYCHPTISLIKQQIWNKKWIYYNGKYPLGLITVFKRSGIDLMRFTRVSGEILDQALFTTSVNCSIDEGGGSSLLTFSLRIAHMFLMGDKSGELGGHISLFQKFGKFVLVWAGASSCWKTKCQVFSWNFLSVIGPAFRCRWISSRRNEARMFVWEN